MRSYHRSRLFALACIASLALSAPALAEGKVVWGYHGDMGPEHWGTLTDSHGGQAFPLCGTGNEQSPIDLSIAKKNRGRTPITFSYRPTPLKIKNNGHTVQVDYGPGSTMTIGGNTYDLLQSHFHGPSEHQLRGKPFAMEGHLVHGRGSGSNLELAVVGFLMEAGDFNPFLKPIWDHMPAKKGATVVDGKAVNARDLLPATRDYYAYDGSLTTPPCTEGVKWHVLTQPIQVSRAQIGRFAKLFHGNARPVQKRRGQVSGIGSN